jgi:hypothetical protein
MLQIEPMSESIQSIKEVETNALIQAFDRIVGIPGVNVLALVKQLLIRLGNKNIKEILPELSELGQEKTVEGLANLAAQAPLPGQEGMSIPKL